MVNARRVKIGKWDVRNRAAEELLTKAHEQAGWYQDGRKILNFHGGGLFGYESARELYELLEKPWTAAR
jgi:hypothetical protein